MKPTFDVEVEQWRPRASSAAARRIETFVHRVIGEEGVADQLVVGPELIVPIGALSASSERVVVTVPRGPAGRAANTLATGRPSAPGAKGFPNVEDWVAARREWHRIRRTAIAGWLGMFKARLEGLGCRVVVEHDAHGSAHKLTVESVPRFQ